MTLRDVAAASGVSLARIHQIEVRCDSNPTVETLARIGAALGVTPVYFVRGFRL